MTRQIHGKNREESSNCNLLSNGKVLSRDLLALFIVCL